MRETTVFTLVLVAVFFLTTSATIINIPDDYPTIQEGIDASNDGDTVLVERDTYVECINFNGTNITVASNYIFSGDPLDIQNTVIDGDSSGTVVTFESGEDGSSMITGFTIRNGYDQFDGGGIYCYDATPVISDNIITGNNVNRGGAGIICWEAAPLITGNVISGNYARTWGGGIDCHSSNPVIDRNVIDNNSSGGPGGGIYCYTSEPVISNNVISGNYAEYSGAGICASVSAPQIISNKISGNTSDSHGGGIGCDSGNPLIENNLIIGNTADPSGGGIYCSDSDPFIINNTLCLNTADLLGGGIFVINDSDPFVANCILWADSSVYGPEIYVINSSPIVLYCDVQGGWEGEGNIDLLPLFRDPVNDDYHLMSIVCGDSSDSPCIDAGHPDIFDSLLDCSWGLGALRSDMGAYGGGDWVQVGIDDRELPVPTRLALLQNYPNPFNATTTLSYMLPQSGPVIVSVYNLLGQRIATLSEGDQQAGQHSLVWDATEFPSGVYFARLGAKNYSKSIKMVLLK